MSNFEGKSRIGFNFVERREYEHFTRYYAGAFDFDFDIGKRN